MNEFKYVHLLAPGSRRRFSRFSLIMMKLFELVNIFQIKFKENARRREVKREVMIVMREWEKPEIYHLRTLKVVYDRAHGTVHVKTSPDPITMDVTNYAPDYFEILRGSVRHADLVYFEQIDHKGYGEYKLFSIVKTSTLMEPNTYFDAQRDLRRNDTHLVRDYTRFDTVGWWNVIT